MRMKNKHTGECNVFVLFLFVCLFVCFVFLPHLVLFDTGFTWCSLVECFVFFQRKERLLPVGLSHTNNERAKVVQLLSECVLEPQVMTEKVRSPSLARGRWALSN